MYRLAAVAAVFGSILTGVTIVLGKFAADVLPLLVFLVLYLVLAVLLFKQKRVAVWVAFFVGLAGVAAALTGAISPSAAPDTAFYALAMINFIIAVCMLTILIKKIAPS